MFSEAPFPREVRVQHDSTETRHDCSLSHGRILIQLTGNREGADKGNGCPQSTAGETSTRQKAEQALIYNLSHVSFSWLKAPVKFRQEWCGSMRAAMCTEYSYAPAAADARCHSSIFAGLRNYSGEPLIPVFPFLLSTILFLLSIFIQTCIQRIYKN